MQPEIPLVIALVVLVAPGAVYPWQDLLMLWKHTRSGLSHVTGNYSRGNHDQG